MKNFGKRTLSLLLAVTMLLGMTSLFAGCGGSGDDADTFTIWMGSSVDSAYYTN